MERFMNNRTTSGFNSKLDGHAFEFALANHLSLNTGIDFYKVTDNRLKTDLMDVNGRYKISVKNSDHAHTQVALISQNTFSAILDLNNNESKFLKLFFGFADGSPLNESKLKSFNINIADLSYDDEVYRNRVLVKNIPQDIFDIFMKKLNHHSKSGSFFDKLIKGDSNILAWVSEKNSINGVTYCKMEDVLNLLKTGTWKTSSNGSTLEFVVENKRLLYVQMKGSSKRYSSGYHSPMFHLYRDIVRLIPSSPNPLGAI
jgi:hypothetical protein